MAAELRRAENGTTRISNGTGPQDLGGGEAQLTTSRDMAVARPVFQPTSRLVVVQSDEVGVSAMTVDATWRRVDCTCPPSLTVCRW